MAFTEDQVFGLSIPFNVRRAGQGHGFSAASSMSSIRKAKVERNEASFAP
jgi:hypothetical protein